MWLRLDIDFVVAYDFDSAHKELLDALAVFLGREAPSTQNSYLDQVLHCLRLA